LNLLEQSQRLVSVFSSTDDLDLFQFREHPLEPLADQGRIVHDQDLQNMTILLHHASLPEPGESEQSVES
jgi:hypothetical protein